VLIDVVTIFPQYLAPLGLSLVGKAQDRGLLQVRVHDLRDWTTDRHRTVDDTPLGGGAGMVMKPDVWGRALESLLRVNDHPNPVVEPVETTQRTTSATTPSRRPRLIIPTPSGDVFTQHAAEALAAEQHLVFACGRYEGIDARVAEHFRAAGVPVSEYSIGDYVLNGGEVAALAMIEAVVRLLPGVVGNPDSLAEESHGTGDGGTAGLLEYPVYTRPTSWAGLDVPEVLLSGHHGKIARWRRDQALVRTAQRRPDLLAALDPQTLNRADRDTLRAIGWEVIDGRLRASTGDMAD